jgi:hypothetical protein
VQVGIQRDVLFIDPENRMASHDLLIKRLCHRLSPNGLSLTTGTQPFEGV